MNTRGVNMSSVSEDRYNMILNRAVPLDRSPMRDLCNKMQPASPVPIPVQYQWVLQPGGKPVQLKQCSVSLDLLHTCEQCDRDFATVERLMDHSKTCDGKAEERPRNRPRIPPIKIVKVPIKHNLSAVKRKTDSKRRSRPEKRACVVEPTPEERRAFFGGLGLTENVRAKSEPRRSNDQVVMKLPAKVLKRFEFTHLPEQLRLRNFSFKDNESVEKQNAENIEGNWWRLDACSKAYPASHRRFQTYIPPGQTFRVVDPLDEEQPRPPTPLKRRSTRSSDSTDFEKLLAQCKPCCVEMPRISPADVAQAELGVDIDAIVKKYKKPDQTENEENKGAKLSLEAQIKECEKTKRLVVVLERVSPETVEKYLHPPRTALGASPASQMGRESVIKSPRRKLLNSFGVKNEYESDDEIVFLGYYKKK